MCSVCSFIMLSGGERDEYMKNSRSVSSRSAGWEWLRQGSHYMLFQSCIYHLIRHSGLSCIWCSKANDMWKTESCSNSTPTVVHVALNVAQAFARYSLVDEELRDLIHSHVDSVGGCNRESVIHTLFSYEGCMKGFIRSTICCLWFISWLPWRCRTLLAHTTCARRCRLLNSVKRSRNFGQLTNPRVRNNFMWVLYLNWQAGMLCEI